MRITLEIDDDIIDHARVLAQRDGCTLDQVVSSLAENGLAKLGIARSQKFTMRNAVPVFPSCGEIVTLEKIRKIMDEEGI